MQQPNCLTKPHNPARLGGLENAAASLDDRGAARRSVGVVGITTQVRVALHLTERDPAGCASRHLFVGVLKRNPSPQTLQQSRSSICLVTAMPAPPKVWHHAEIAAYSWQSEIP